MLVEILDAVGDRLGKPHFAGDVGAAMAARLDQFAGDLAAVLEDVDDGAEPFGEAGFQAGMAKHEAQRLRQAAVDELEVLFEGEIIGQIQLADPRRVAAAAKILQQQRIIEFGNLGLAEADFPADFDADTAASHAMSGRLSLGEIERVAECAQQFRKRDLVELPRGERGYHGRDSGNSGRQTCRVASPTPHQITRGLTGCESADVHAQVMGGIGPDDLVDRRFARCAGLGDRACWAPASRTNEAPAYLSHLALAMAVWMPTKCPACRPNCLAIWGQQAQLGAAASFGGRS